MKNKIDYSLYLCTDSSLMTTNTVEESVELAIMGGVTIVQLREKKATAKEFFETALKVKEVTKKYNVPLIINDRIDIALAVKADGVHLGQKDIPASAARKILGDEYIIGVSTNNVEQGIKAMQDGADYIGIGAAFVTGTKNDTKPVSYETIKNITDNVNIPAVAIGGINRKNIIKLYGTGINGVAVVSAIVAQTDITSSAKELLDAVKKNLGQ